MTVSDTKEVSARITGKGYSIRYGSRDYQVIYPEEIWGPVPPEMKNLLVDHLAMVSALHLPMKLHNLNGLDFSTARPFFEPHFITNALRDIPSCCDMDGKDIAAETERFLSLDYRYASEQVRLPSTWPQPAKPVSDAVIPLSFGKDSLLTFALAEELGLRPRGVFVDEPSFSGERGHKEELGRKLKKDFGHTLEILEHQPGLLRDSGHLGVPVDEYGWGLQSTEYALLMLPYARAWGARYILFGNEQTAGAFYMDASGRWTVHPCYDQSPHWTRHINAMTSALTMARPVGTGSIIEPLMDMMVQRILVRRYPRYAPLQMSCFAEGEEGAHYRWCHACPICAKMYLMCAGGGVDPREVGFRHSLLTEKERGYFSMMGGEGGFPYARTGAARDEQLFAFHCAARFGHEDPLVREFAASPLADEARRREEELLARFASLHTSITVPEEISGPLMKIFEEEIAGFIRQYREAK